MSQRFERLAVYAWRLVIIAAATAIVVWSAGQLLVVLVPVTVAALVTRGLWPINRTLRKRRLPAAAAAACCLVVFFAVVATAIGLAGAALAGEADDIGPTTTVRHRRHHGLARRRQPLQRLALRRRGRPGRDRGVVRDRPAFERGLDRWCAGRRRDRGGLAARRHHHVLLPEGRRPVGRSGGLPSARRPARRWSVDAFVEAGMPPAASFEGPRHSGSSRR